MSKMKKIVLLVLATFSFNNTLIANLQILNRGNGVEPETLDANKAATVSTCAIVRDLYETLVIMAPDGSPIPAAAEKWDISEDGKTYLFYLRQNGKWSNGDPLTAHDFEFSFKRLVTPMTASPYANHLYPVVNAKDIVSGKLSPDELGVKALDDHRFEIKLVAPTEHFLSLMLHTCFSPLHKASLVADPSNFTKPGKLISNGAFKLEKWVPNDAINLIKNSHYWDAAHVKLDQENFLPLSGDTEINAYRAGQLHMTNSVNDDKMSFVKMDPDLSKDLVSIPYFAIAYLGLNLTQAPLKDNLKLRRALSLATDRELLTKSILASGEQAYYSWIYPNTRNHKSCALDIKDMSREERLKEAQRLYQEAGYSSTNPLEIEIRYNTDESRKKQVTAIADMWKTSLGVKVRTTNTEWKVFLADRKEKRVTQVFYGRLVGLYNDPNTFAECMTSGSGMNDTGFENMDYDNLVIKAAHEPNLEMRKQMFYEAEKILLDTHALIPLFTFAWNQLVSPKVKGYQPNLNGLIYAKNIWLAD